MATSTLQDSVARAAFPIPALIHPTSGQQLRPGAGGLTKLEHATITIAAGLAANSRGWNSIDDFAEESVGIAVALFKTLDKLDVSTL